MIHSLSTILGNDSSAIIMEVHPSLNDLCGITKNISDTILDKLNITVESLFEEKKNRLDKVLFFVFYVNIVKFEKLFCY